MIRDVMQNAGMVNFAELGLILFLFGFGLMLIRVWAMSKHDTEQLANLPLEQDEP